MKKLLQTTVQPPANFLFELLVRFFSKTPKFFVTIQILAAVALALSNGIAYLHNAEVVLPAWIDVIGEASVKVVSITALLLAQATVKNPIR